MNYKMLIDLRYLKNIFFRSIITSSIRYFTFNINNNSKGIIIVSNPNRKVFSFKVVKNSHILNMLFNVKDNERGQLLVKQRTSVILRRVVKKKEVKRYYTKSSYSLVKAVKLNIERTLFEKTTTNLNSIHEINVNLSNEDLDLIRGNEVKFAFPTLCLVSEKKPLKIKLDEQNYKILKDLKKD